MMESKLKLIKLLLLLLVPTVFSVEAVVTGCHSQLLGWTKCWVIFALAALLDLALPARLHQGRLAEMVKIAFLAWCLLPLNINGSDLLFDFVVAPVHWVVTTAMDLCRPAWQYMV